MTVFQNNAAGKRRVAFGAPYPGRIVPVHLAELGGMLSCRRTPSRAAKGVSIGVAFQKKLGVGFFGGEGFIMSGSRVTAGRSSTPAGCHRAPVERGESLRVDTGCIVGFQPSVAYDIQMVRGVKSAIFGGEELILATLSGPGKSLQSLPSRGGKPYRRRRAGRRARRARRGFGPRRPRQAPGRRSVTKPLREPGGPRGAGPPGGVQCTRTGGSDDEQRTHIDRVSAVAVLLCFPLPAPPPSPTPTPPSTATTAISTRRASGSTPSTRSTSGAPKATSRSCASAATARRRISIPSGSSPARDTWGRGALVSPPRAKRGGPRSGGLHQLPLHPCGRRRPGAAARFPRVGRSGEFDTWQDCAVSATAAGWSSAPRTPGTTAPAPSAIRPSLPGQNATVTPAGGRLCSFCHGSKDEAHCAGVNPFWKPQPCTGCHDPHLGKDHPARLKAGYLDPIRDMVTLNPHRKRTSVSRATPTARPAPFAARMRSLSASAVTAQERSRG